MSTKLPFTTVKTWKKIILSRQHYHLLAIVGRGTAFISTLGSVSGIEHVLSPSSSVLFLTTNSVSLRKKQP